MNHVYQKIIRMIEQSSNPGMIETVEKFISQAKSKGYLNLAEQADIKLMLTLKREELTVIN